MKSYGAERAPTATRKDLVRFMMLFISTENPKRISTTVFFGHTHGDMWSPILDSPMKGENFGQIQFMAPAPAMGSPESHGEDMIQMHTADIGPFRAN
jgi:hypothetical protein